MGAVGHIMTGSGLEELWTTVYAKSSVCHMITGHAHSRALRAHCLTHEAVAMMLLELDESSLGKDVVNSARKLHEDLLTHQLSPLGSRVCSHL